ncbi:MarR family winged helix-turn-helix transcriptional regulator [Microbacterium gorillae]|uniref:MarR family winged helix-turn-helix transcriptional regulator n=1 Tax=Microbacterium gorillae TaxID=1231063 RepID=UPI00059029A6|nr:MarR family transcriptional regulator [Microbacterium gorillae]
MTLTESPDDDTVDRVRARWAQTLPEVDTSPLEVLGRIARIGAQTSQLMDRSLATSGVSRSEFDVLCALARSDRPLRASEVTAQTMLSGAATTKLTVRLESAGLLTRERLERDGRVVLLQLTEAGRELVAREFPRALDGDRLLLRGLTQDERDQLASLLKVISGNADRADVS